MSVHATAVVEAGASIGGGTQVWHFVHVRADARIGRDCTLGKNVFVDAGVVVGDRVKLQNNVSVYAGVTLEDDVFVGPNAVVTNDRVPRSGGAWEVTTTRVASGASIGANATVVRIRHRGMRPDRGWVGRHQGRRPSGSRDGQPGATRGMELPVRGGACAAG